MSAPAPTPGRRRGARTSGRWRPTPAELVDAGFLLALCGAALLGLAPTYTGSGFAVVGIAGVLVGIVLVHVTSTLRWPAVAPVLLAVLAFFLLGGPLCLRADGAVAPTPHTLGLLTDQLLFGWKDLLTTLPPVDGDGRLLVLPWALGLAAGTLGALLARVSAGPVWLRSLLPLLAPLLLLAAVILMGVRSPSSVWTQGAVVAALGLTWLVLRAHRARGAGGGWQRPADPAGHRCPAARGCRCGRPAGRHLGRRRRPGRRRPGGAAHLRRATLRRRAVPLAAVVLPSVRRDAGAGRRQPLRPGPVHHRGRAGRLPGPDRHPRRLRRRGLGCLEQRLPRRHGRHLPAGRPDDRQPGRGPARRRPGDARGGVRRGLAAHHRGPPVGGVRDPRRRVRRQLPLQPGQRHGRGAARARAGGPVHLHRGHPARRGDRRLAALRPDRDRGRGGARSSTPSPPSGPRA